MEVAMDDVTRVVVALEAHDVTEEVLHFLDRSGRARVVGTASDDRQLAEAVRQLEPDVVVAEPSLVGDGTDGAALLALATRESVAALRTAVRVGARGFFVWPAERDGLLDGVASAGDRRALVRRATVVAVHASRGGAGCTFVATHLAQALAARGASCVLIDADPTFGDVATALGAVGDVRTLADLAPVADELTWEHVDGASVSHPSGFRALLSGAGDPPSPGGTDPVRSALNVAATTVDVVLVHLPRNLDERARRCLEEADRGLEVLSLDVLSFRATSRALEVLAPLALEDRLGFVVNRAARAELTVADVRRVFGHDPVAVVPADPAVGRAQDRGTLLRPKGRLGRAFGRLAATIPLPADGQG
jgi:MinD-like ATPase involved in chromosome partitioning or flagellar assembly